MSKKFAKMNKKTCRTPVKCFKLHPFAKKIKAKQKNQFITQNPNT